MGDDNWWELITDGTPVVVYDAEHNVTLSGDDVTEWAPVVGGTAYDVMKQVGVAGYYPHYTADATPYFPGRAAVYSSVAAGEYGSLISDLTSATLISQPCDVVALGRMQLTASDVNWLSAGGSGSANRLIFKASLNRYRILLDPLPVAYWYTASTTLAFLLWIHCEGANTFARQYIQNGTNRYSGLLTCGTDPLRGMGIFTSPSLGPSACNGHFSGVGRYTGVTLADYNRVVGWAKATMKWN
jgi:hypothetical protein